MTKIIPARIELTIKFNQLPMDCTPGPAGAQTFEVGGENGGPTFVVTLNKKSYKKLITAAEQWPEWLAVIGASLGEQLSRQRFRLVNAGLTNVIERKPKPAADASEAQTQAEGEATAQPTDAAPENPAPITAVAAPVAPAPVAPHVEPAPPVAPAAVVPARVAPPAAVVPRVAPPVVAQKPKPKQPSPSKSVPRAAAPVAAPRAASPIQGINRKAQRSRYIDPIIVSYRSGGPSRSV